MLTYLIHFVDFSARKFCSNEDQKELKSRVNMCAVSMYWKRELCFELLWNLSPLILALQVVKRLGLAEMKSLMKMSQRHIKYIVFCNFNFWVKFDKVVSLGNSTRDIEVDCWNVGHKWHSGLLILLTKIQWLLFRN